MCSPSATNVHKAASLAGKKQSLEGFIAFYENFLVAKKKTRTKEKRSELEGGKRKAEKLNHVHVHAVKRFSDKTKLFLPRVHVNIVYIQNGARPPTPPTQSISETKPDA